MVRIVDGLQGDLTGFALVPLVVLPAADRIADRFVEEPIGLPGVIRNDIMLAPRALIGVLQACQFLAVAREKRVFLRDVNRGLRTKGVSARENPDQT